MGNMLPGNSFPQICVVSVCKFLNILDFRQDYGRRVDISNLSCLLISNRLRIVCGGLAAIPLAAIPLTAINEAGALK
jgi:hypothetical protein